MNLQDVALRFVEPGEQYQLAAGSGAVKTLCESRIDCQPGIWRSFPSLMRAIFAPLQRRAHDSNGSKPVRVYGSEVYHEGCTSCSYGFRQVGWIDKEPE
jgi:hypothetical protein